MSADSDEDFYGDEDFYPGIDEETDEEIEARRPCIGADCVNPHRPHRYGECETREMHEAMAEEHRHADDQQ